MHWNSEAPYKIFLCNLHGSKTFHNRSNIRNTTFLGLENNVWGRHLETGAKKFRMQLTQSASSSSEMELPPSSSVDNWIRARLLSAKTRVRRLSKRRWRRCEHTIFRIVLRNERRPTGHNAVKEWTIPTNKVLSYIILYNWFHKVTFSWKCLYKY